VRGHADLIPIRAAVSVFILYWATYDASRASETGHADLAWALMHALDWEPLEGAAGAGKGFMELFG
jgi:hypothetical protein